MKTIQSSIFSMMSNLQKKSVMKFKSSLYRSLAMIGMMVIIASTAQAEKAKDKWAPSQEAQRKCPLGPYDRCGELVGAYPQHKDKFPSLKRKIGGVDYLIPSEFFQNPNPTTDNNQLIAYWIPLAHFLDGREVAGTLYARESIKYGLMWPYGVRIKIQANPYPGKRPNTYTSCVSGYIAKDPHPLQMAFDMTMYRDRSFDNQKKHGKTIDLGACFVSDDPKYILYRGLPVAYQVHPHTLRDGRISRPGEELAVTGFTLPEDKVYVEYMFQTAIFPYWKDIHRAVLKLIKSWEQ